MVKLWIQEAIKKPGALRETVRRRFGDKGFTKKGTIKVEVLRFLSKEKGVTGQRARLALKLRGFKEKGKGVAKKAGASLKSKAKSAAKKAAKRVKRKLKKALKSKKKKRKRRKKSKRSRKHRKNKRSRKGRRKGRKR